MLACLLVRNECLLFRNAFFRKSLSVRTYSDLPFWLSATLFVATSLHKHAGPTILSHAFEVEDKVAEREKEKERVGERRGPVQTVTTATTSVFLRNLHSVAANRETKTLVLPWELRSFATVAMHHIAPTHVVSGGLPFWLERRAASEMPLIAKVAPF